MFILSELILSFSPQYCQDWCWSLPPLPSPQTRSPPSCSPATTACRTAAMSQSWDQRHFHNLVGHNVTIWMMPWNLMETQLSPRSRILNCLSQNFGRKDKEKSQWVSWYRFSITQARPRRIEEIWRLSLICQFHLFQNYEDSQNIIYLRNIKSLTDLWSSISLISEIGSLKKTGKEPPSSERRQILIFSHLFVCSCRLLTDILQTYSWHIKAHQNLRFKTHSKK